MGAVAVGAVLFSLFLLIAAAMVWQEVRGADDTEPTYVLEEVVPFVFQRLSAAAAASIDRDDVMRILEWEVYYLQGLGGDGRAATPPVAGSMEGLGFILERSRDAGFDYRADDVAEVLALEVAYLHDIGAVGPAVQEGRSS